MEVEIQAVPREEKPRIMNLEPRIMKFKCRRCERRHLNFKIQMPAFTTTAIELYLNAAVQIAGFCIFQMPAFPLPALSSILGNNLKATLILFLFFLNGVFPYKTPRCMNICLL